MRPFPGEQGQFEVISGHRRVLAARQKKWSHIEAKVVDVPDDVAEVYGLEENLRRKSVPNQARAIARLVELYQSTATSRRGGDRRSQAFRGRPKRQDGAFESATQRAARIAQLSVREVQRIARIGRQATPKVRKALADKAIPITVAEQLVGLLGPEQDRQLRLVLRPRRGKPVEIVPEIQKALDSLDHAARALTAFGKSRLPPEVVTEFQKRHAAVGAALDRLASPSCTRGKSRLSSLTRRWR